MLLQVKPERWLCMATSFAMALGVPVSKLLTEIGHDGSQIVFPDLPEPACRAGHHVQECIQASLNRGIAFTPIEFNPITRTFGNPPTYHSILPDEQARWRRFANLMTRREGVIEGWVTNWGHAMAFENGVIFDPDLGHRFQFSQENCLARNFTPRCLWLHSEIPG
jgi:hypothetical protein